MLVLGRKEIPARWFLPHPARRTRANRRASGSAYGAAGPAHTTNAARLGAAAGSTGA